MKKKIIAILLIAIMLIALAACAANNEPTPPAQTEPPTEATANGGDEVAPPPAQVIDEDREGNPITLPETITTVISMGPATTEILSALGFADKIIAVDTFSDNIAGIDPSIAILDMMAPDGERIIALQPDVLFVAGISRYGADDPFRLIADAGICVIFIPSSTSIAGIQEDIRFIAAVMDNAPGGEQLIENMNREIDAVRQVSATITERRTVYFEVSPAPWMVSFGSDTFLNEMIEIIGAENVFAAEEGWMSVSDEIIVVTNPDVILTSVDFIDNPVGEILSRPGWDAITAVQNGDVFYIDTDASNRPSHNIVLALFEMAMVVYPDYFGG